MKAHLNRLCTAVLLVSVVLAAFSPLQPAQAQDTPPPETVTIPGTIQSKLGCSGDWQPDCDKTFLTYDEGDDVWQGEFDIPAGNYEYKVALNKSWSENYGLNAKRDGPNIALALAAQAKVKFYYDHKTRWVTDNQNSLIPVLVGDFQTKLGCAQDNDPTCLRGWLQDTEDTGTYSFATSKIPAGTYEVRVALNENLEETFGAEGIKGEPAIRFEVPLRTIVYFGFDAATKRLVVSTDGAPRGNLFKAQAHWVSRDTILWGIPGSTENSYALAYAPDGGMKLELGQLKGAQEIPLTYTVGGRPAGIDDRFPHLSKLTAFQLLPENVAQVPEIIKGQVAVVARNSEGKLVDATSVQIPGILDDLFYYPGKLGVAYENGVPVLRVWAPTARSVKLHIFADSRPATRSRVLAMDVDSASGVWSITGEANWTNQFYLYEVEVYVPSQGRPVQNLVTDPYSISLTMDSTRSQIVDLDDPALKPADWDGTPKPPLEAPEDIVIYELHVRDFSIFDPSIPEADRGTFKAFTHLESNGMQHLGALAAAGLTHIHLLPAFDIASVIEDKSQWRQPDPAELAALPPDSPRQQELVDATRSQDGFNWGYDPYHYNTPEGSYATEPDGPTRILEFRQMVQALNSIGLRVVMDVVYNHTNASGQSVRSVLDKVVPGYYHRLNAEGLVETSTCCQNTASEHAMMEKLMVDSLVLWSTAYKVDGFRFDLMGHHMLENMQNARAALDALTVVQDGVDGQQIYVYGEGWNFGEVANNARGVNAVQLNIGGTGIGVFNDRLRDGARGGGPFSGAQEQGFVTGLFFDPNEIDQGSPDEQQFRLLKISDWVRIGLAGNLKDFQMVNYIGKRVTGEEIDYNGSPAGYTLDPQENINYVSAHDNETLFDAIQLKAPTGATIADRVRMQNMGMSLVMLGQGVPFFHAGDELLRSKSLDRNSYDSGDWFNRLDFTYKTNNFGAGLPPAGENSAKWPFMGPLLANAAITPQQADILFSAETFKELLQIRKSSPLFRLRTADEVQQRLSFANTGPDQIPGVIVMNLADPRSAGGAVLDPNYALIVVVFNANKNEVTIAQDYLKGVQMALHPVQAQSHDPLTRTARFDTASGAFTVPGRTASVFVSEVGPAPTATPAALPTSSQAPSATPAPTTTPAPAALPTETSVLPPAAAEPSGPAVSPEATIGFLGAVLAVTLGLVYFVRRRKR